MLLGAYRRFPINNIRIKCDPHDEPASFYDQDTDSFKCIVCLSGGGLFYIDKAIKKEVEGYEAIKELLE